jgi:outer membrane autotransporter protein
MFKNKCDFKSRFKILKGGKISLMVSALALGSLVNIANAEDITISDIKTSMIYYFSNDVTNTYTFSNTGGFNITNDQEEYGLYINDADTYTITNNGTFNFVNLNTVAEPGATAIYTRGGGDFYITNNNTINISSSGYGVYGIVNSTNGLGSITNNSTITVKYEGEYDYKAYAISSSSTVDVTNSNTGILNGNLYIRKTLTNNGTISLPYNATNATIGTLVNTGTLEIGLLTDGQTTTYSQLATTDATFNAGSIINVNVLAASTNVDLIAGTTLNDVVSSSNLLTINDLTVTDNSALLNFNYVKDGNTIDLNTVQAQTIEEAVATPDNTATDIYVAKTITNNTQRAARVLDKINAATTNTAMDSVFVNLNTLSTNAEVSQAVESTTPQTGTANLNASTQISNNIQGIVDTRQNINMGGGLNSGEEMFADKNFWMKAFGSIGEQDDKNGINGFDLRAKGFGLGIDGEKNNKQIGAAFFYTNANVDVNNISQSSNLDVFTALIYGNIPVIDDKTKLLYQASYSWQNNSSTRDIAFMGTTASADYTTTVASADLKLVRDYKITNSFMVQPLIQTTYRYFDSPSYNETGAGALNLHVNSFNSSQLLAGGGLIAHYKIDEDSKIIGNINALYDVNNKKQTVTSSYEGAVGVEFDTDGIDNGRWQYETGIAYERNITKGSNVNFGYNYQEQGSFDNHTLSAKYVYTF